MSEFTQEEIDGIVKALAEPSSAPLDQKIPLRPLYKVEFSPLEEETRGEKPSLEHLPVEIEVLFGKTTIPLKKLLSLHQGGILDLDQEVDQKVEILANGKKIGYGEIVSSEGKFGVKIVQLLR
jgi:flagellar motor switch protein FliN